MHAQVLLGHIGNLEGELVHARGIVEPSLAQHLGAAVSHIVDVSGGSAHTHVDVRHIAVVDTMSLARHPQRLFRAVGQGL